MNIKYLYKCDLCRSEKLSFLYTIEDYNRGFEGAFNLYKCENCGLRFLNPQPVPKELEKYYSQGYYSYINIKKEESSTPRIKFIRKLYYIYMKHNFIFTFFLFPFSPFIRGIKIIPNGKYLDIGCGGGQFLYEIKRLNPTAEYYGIEVGNFDEKDVKEHGLKIFKGTLEESHYPDNYFDVITMNHVFEHVHNPSETMKELKRILKLNGNLIIAVPNSRSLAYKLFGKYWYQLDAPRHLFVYSDKTLKKYSKKFNFKIERIRYGNISDSFTFIASIMHIINKFIYKKKNLWKLIFKRMQKEDFFITAIFGFLHFSLIPLITFLNILKFGDSVEIWLKK